MAKAPVGAEKLLLPNHPPFVYPLMALLSNLDFRTAYYFNFFISLLIFSPAVMVVFRILRKKGWALSHSVIMVIGLLLFEPFYISLLKGQDTYLLYMGGLFLLSGWLLGKDWLSGIGLGLTLIRPQITLVLALPFLFRWRKIWWWFLVTAVVLVFYSFAQVGWYGAINYIKVLLLSTGVEEFGWDEVGMFNLVGLLIRLLPGLSLDLIHIIGWGFYFVSVAGLCMLWKLSKSISHWHLSLAVVLSLFTAPHLHYHDLALLAVPIVSMVMVGVMSGRLKALPAVALPIVISVILVFGELWEQVLHTIPYLLMVGLPFITLKLERSLLPVSSKGRQQ